MASEISEGVKQRRKNMKRDKGQCFSSSMAISAVDDQFLWHLPFFVCHRRGNPVPSSVCSS